MSSVVCAQFNPPQNLNLIHHYVFPNNYYNLYWEPPEPGVPDLVNYNIYVNWEIYDIVSENILNYTVIDAMPADTSYYVYFYITALYENPAGESNPSNIVYSVPAISNDNIVSQSEKMLGNYPNPFKSLTTFSFSSKELIQNAEIKIYNVKGQLVRELHPVFTSPSHSIELTWDGKDKHGFDVVQGIYFYKCANKDKNIIGKMIKLQ